MKKKKENLTQAQGWGEQEISPAEDQPQKKEDLQGGLTEEEHLPISLEVEHGLHEKKGKEEKIKQDLEKHSKFDKFKGENK